ncbi:glutaredoxin family protein [Desulfobacter postgatei]|jgi:glutaredoxin|uniref:glutaredoxin family protein n=1 Tax=Desulfobacter postgatei TaxID=2293 RepID=UPI002A35CD26|nr:glutaredoxin family protein [Desulfobacter postgatei]MDX9962767.1 glutaredoxin family protein [Desulfobacter postgatei]
MCKCIPKIYGLSTCSHCRATRKLFDKHNIEYDYIQVDDFQGDERNAVLNEIKTLNPRCSFPTIKINKETVIVGNKENDIKKALGIIK